jgi:hypothetical protein
VRLANHVFGPRQQAVPVRAGVDRSPKATQMKLILQFDLVAVPRRSGRSAGGDVGRLKALLNASRLARSVLQLQSYTAYFHTCQTHDRLELP